jgi:2-phosphoglycerate kinase
MPLNQLDRIESDDARVVLIGGAPRSGKSTVARMLAAKLGYNYLSIDDLGEAIRAVTTKQSHPALHPMTGYEYKEYYIQLSIEELNADAIAEHHAIWPALESVIRKHVLWAEPAIIEGWSLQPEYVASLAIPSVKSLWFISDENVLKERINGDVQFYRGATDEESMIKNYFGRCCWHNARLKENVARLGMASVEVSFQATPTQLAGRCLDLLRVCRNGG